MARRFLVFFIILPFTFSGLLFAREDGNETVRILVPKSTASAPFLLMEEKNGANGISVEIEFFVNHPQALARLLRGEADLLFTGTSTGWENRRNGGPLVMINTGVWGVSSLMTARESIGDFSDLRGKRVALPFPGSPLDFQTRSILRETGIGESEVEISFSPFSQTVPKLLAGKIDAAPLPEPLATSMELKKGLIRVIKYQDAWARVTGGNPYSPQVSLFALEEWARENARIIVRINDLWRACTAEAMEDPADAAGKTYRLFEMDERVVRTALGNTLYMVPDFDRNRELVLDYYKRVKDLLPGEGGIDGEFFFNPVR